MRNVQRCYRVAVGILGLVVGSQLNAQHDPRQGGWAHENAPLEPDPAVTTGTLENGLRYAYLPHRGVPGRVSLRLVVLAGSLDERDQERGLAHFLEHMAFNGTRNFHEDEMSGYFQRLGMEFGSDVNAYTTLGQTEYGLEFARSEPELIREGFALFRDFADGILLEPEAIEKEKGVILSEARIHDGVEMRVGDATSEFFFPGMRFSQRSPLGLTGIIQNATRRDLEGFYRRNYRPDLMILVAAGDFDLKQFEAWTREYMGDLTRPSDPIPTRRLGELESQRKLRARILPVSQSGSTQIKAASPAIEPFPHDSTAFRRQELYRHFATNLMSNRLRERIPRSGGGDAIYQRQGDMITGLTMLSVSPAEWEHGVRSIDDLIRIILSEGFDRDEIEPVLRRALLQMKIQRAQVSEMDPKPLADRMVDSITEGKVMIRPESELDMQRNFLEELTPESANRAFAEVWSPDQLSYFLSGEITVEGGSAKVVRALNAARKQKPRDGGSMPSSPVGLSMLDLTQSVPVYKPSGKSGRVVEKTTLPGFDATLYRFDNHVRFNVMESTREPGLVRTVIRVGNGFFQDYPIRKGLREFALNTVLASGTERYPAEHIHSFLERNVLEFSFDVSDHDAFTFRGLCQREDLEEFYAILADFLRNPRFSHRAHRTVRYSAAIDRMSRSIGITDGMRAFQDYLFGDDGRFAWGTPYDYRDLRVSHVQKWLGDALVNGYVEVSLVGDISTDEALDINRRTFGLLPERKLEKPSVEPLPVRVEASPGYERLEFMGETHQAAAMGMWPTHATHSLEERMGLLVISRVLEQRIRVLFREQLGLAYAPSAEFVSHPEYDDFGYIQAYVDCAPQDAETIARALSRVADELAVDGMTELEFRGAVNPIQSHLEQALKTNSMILDRLLKQAQEKPGAIHEMRRLQNGAFRTLELEDVNALAASVLKSESSRTAAVVPKPFVGVFRIDSESDGQQVIGR